MKILDTPADRARSPRLRKRSRSRPRQRASSPARAEKHAASATESNSNGSSRVAHPVNGGPECSSAVSASSSVSALSSSVSTGAGDDAHDGRTSRSSVAAAHEKGLGVKTHLLDIHHVPAHLAFNVHIKRGYRPLAHWTRAVASVFTHISNETFNIWSHLIAGLVALAWLIQLVRDAPSEAHYFVIAVGLACGVVCFSGSVAYHALMPATTTVESYRRLLMADLVGVWAVNAGIQTCVSYLLLPCAPPIVKFALTAVPAVGALLWIAVFAPTPALRMAAFGVQLLTRLGTVSIAFAAGWTHWKAHTTAGHIWLEVLMITGAVINVLRVPERWLPGRLCFTPLQSHTLMHIAASAVFLSHHMQALDQAAMVHNDPDLLACSRRGAAGLW